MRYTHVRFMGTTDPETGPQVIEISLDEIDEVGMRGIHRTETPFVLTKYHVKYWITYHDFHAIVEAMRQRTIEQKNTLDLVDMLVPGS